MDHSTQLLGRAKALGLRVFARHCVQSVDARSVFTPAGPKSSITRAREGSSQVLTNLRRLRSVGVAVAVDGPREPDRSTLSKRSPDERSEIRDLSRRMPRISLRSSGLLANPPYVLAQYRW